MKTFHSLLVLSIGLALHSQATAAELLFTATISHDQETTQGAFLTSGGGPRPESHGFATFNLNDARTSLTFSATIYNIDLTGTQTADINDNLFGAHIHFAAAGVNGPVIWGFFGNPANNNNPGDSVVTPFVGMVGGTFTGSWDLPEGNNTTLGAQLQNILDGNTYINFHTSQFPGGEIRGQITRVPDGGSSAVLLGVAVMGLLALRRKIKG